MYAVLAMAHWRLNHRDAARESLTKGVEIQRAKLPRLESGDLGEGWSDWIISRALLSEAKALVPPFSDSLNE